MYSLTNQLWRRNLFSTTIVLSVLLPVSCFLFPQKSLAWTETCERPHVLGREELIVVATVDGATSKQVLAKVDTGAALSSIDRDLARELGFDLNNANTVVMKSAFGNELRPLVPVRLGIAGQTQDSVFTVTDRSSLSTDALIGRDDLHGFFVDVSASQLTLPAVEHQATDCGIASPQTTAMNHGEDRPKHVLSAEPQAQPTELMLLAMLPLAAMLIVFFRTLIGAQTYGLFAPMLLAVAFLQSGILIGIATFGLVLGIGIIVHPLLRWLHLARVPRLSLLLIVVILTLLSAEQARVHFVSGATWSATMPVVITAAIVEQFWAHWEQGRLADALKMTAWTGLITAVTSLMLHMYSIQLLVVRAPVGLALIGGGICLLLGRYRGLRLVELWRFRSLRRHDATNETTAVLKLPL